MDALKIDTSYENYVFSGLTQSMQVLSIPSPCLEPSTPLSKDETFYRRIDEIYEKAVFWNKNSFDLPDGNAVKHFVQEADRILQLCAKNSSLHNKSLKIFHVLYKNLSENRKRKIIIWNF